MYVAHFAAAMALRGRARRVPIAAWIGGAFLLDMLWIAFGVTGIDATPWTDWSHSLVMSIVWATAFAALFSRFGGRAMGAVWAVVLSHFVLDLLIQGGTAWPGAPSALMVQPPVVAHARMLQIALACLFLGVFVRDEHIAGAFSWRTPAACAIILALFAR